jgi:hypothetical protein
VALLPQGAQHHLELAAFYPKEREPTAGIAYVNLALRADEDPLPGQARGD